MSVQAQKGNKILRISEDAIERYVNMGYNIIGDNGAVIQQGIPVDNNQLKLAYVQCSREIEVLKAEIADLKAQNEVLRAENARLTEKGGSEEKTERAPRRRKQTTETETDTE